MIFDLVNALRGRVECETIIAFAKEVERSGDIILAQGNGRDKDKDREEFALKFTRGY